MYAPCLSALKWFVYHTRRYTSALRFYLTWGDALSVRLLVQYWIPISETAGLILTLAIPINHKQVANE